MKSVPYIFGKNIHQLLITYKKCAYIYKIFMKFENTFLPFNNIFSQFKNIHEFFESVYEMCRIVLKKMFMKDWIA